MRIAYVVGARPNFVKMAPVISDRSQIGRRRRMPDGRHVLIHTGQHYDRLMSDIFLEELGVPAPDHMLGVGSASHAVQTARVMERIEPVLEPLRNGYDALEACAPTMFHNSVLRRSTRVSCPEQRPKTPKRVFWGASARAEQAPR
jgi:hypothetical protein